MASTIDRVKDISVEDFQRNYASRNLPVIISGCVDHWPARKKWNLDYFETRYGDKTLNFSDKNWRLGDFIEQVRSGIQPAPYLNQVKLDEQFPELYDDIRDLKYTRDNLLGSKLVPPGMRIVRGIKALFIGSGGSGFGKLHWDYSYLHVYISQLHGDKDFVVYAPSDSAFLYPKPGFAKNDSVIDDFNNFDADRYPDVRKATPLRFTVHEGETVFVPAGWWHSTKMHGISISIAESALDKFNWNRRYQDYLDEYRAVDVSRLKCAAIDLYMRAVHTFVL